MKTITTALLLLFTVTAFSQTKEETLEWLNQNKNYCVVEYKYNGNLSYKGYTFYEDYFVQHYTYWGSSTLEYDLKVYYKDILLQDLSQLDVENDSKTNPPITYISIPISKYYSKGKDDYSYEQKDASRHYFYYKTDQPNARKNLEKVLREIMHMAKLHGAEPYKDLFGE